MVVLYSFKRGEDMKRWIVPKYSKDLVNHLAEECDIDPFLALISVARGYKDPLELDAFLSCEDVLDDPFVYRDMQKAADCINNAIEENKLIAIYGDYDCDGITATALLYTHLMSRGANVICYIPSRSNEGYGMNIESLSRLDGMGVGLIITVDNGINSVEEVKYANQLGIPIVITDHHIPAGELPDAVAVVDPHRADDESEFKELSGVGVAFKLVCAIENCVPEEMLPLYSDLVAIGTVADVMPLVGENRVFVREGLMYINNTSRVGISSLISVAGLGDKVLSAGNLAFNLAPRINAAGRMGDAMRALNLICSSVPEEAVSLATEIDRENALRQREEAQIEKKAIEIIEENNLMYDRVIVVNGEGWHKGVVGIAASRLVERYSKPVIILSTDGEISVGSGRSVDGFSLFEAISSASDFLQKFGGHALAAGLTIETRLIDKLRQTVNDFARRQPVCVPTVLLDCKLRPSALSLEMGELIKELEPFGKGNQNPLFGIYSLKIERITSIGGGKHLRLLLTREGSVIQALCFHKTADTLPFEVGDTVDVAVNLDISEYGDEKQLSVIIREIRPSGESEIDIETEADYFDFRVGKCRDTTPICPNRDEAGLIYRSLMLPTKKELLINKLCGRLPRGKVLAALDILCELGLINQTVTASGIVYEQIKGAKSDFYQSEILCALKDGEID